MSAKSTWSAEEDRFLRHAWLVDGLSAGEIAMQLSGRSRNSVIGRISRTIGKDAGRRSNVSTRPSVVPSKKRPGMNVHMNGRLNKIEAHRNPPAPKPVLLAPTGGNKVLLDDLPRYGRCRFPLWPDNSFPTTDEMFHCGEATAMEAVYCGFHAQRCQNERPA